MGIWASSTQARLRPEVWMLLDRAGSGALNEGYRRTPAPSRDMTGAAMTENAAMGDDNRVHNQAPAEGDPDADPQDLRMHSQDPAEGADDAGDAADK